MSPRNISVKDIYNLFPNNRIMDTLPLIKVGDSTIDIEEGRNAGCLYNIGVTTGAHTKEELSTANPNYIFDNIYDLKSVILTLNQA